MTSKADYVRGQGQTRNHHCHWPGCERQVPPAMWGCKGHWFTLPAGLRARIWATYKPGQEVNGTPSAAYIEAAKAVQAWIAEQSKRPTPIKPVAASVSSRRRAAKKIEALRQREADLLNAVEMNQGLLRHQGDKISRLERIIDQAKRTAGRMSILFPAVPQKVAGPLQRRLRVEVTEPLDFFNLNSECMKFEIKELETLIAGVSADALRRSVHFWATFDDGKVAYAISQDDLRFMDGRDAEHLLETAIAPSLARELMNRVGRRR